MKEYKQYADGAHILYQEDVTMKQMFVTQCAHIGKLVTYNLMWYIPSDKDAGQEANDR